MRRLEVSEVRCGSCSVVQPAAQWGRNCPACGGAAFAVEIERSSSGVDWGQMFRSSGLGNSGLASLVEVAFDELNPSSRDYSASSPYYRTDAFLLCAGVSAGALQEFLEAPLEDRIGLYISWKRREIERSLPPGHRICLRCQVEFKVYDNHWGRAGLCSKACHHACLKGRPGNS